VISEASDLLADTKAGGKLVGRKENPQLVSVERWLEFGGAADVSFNAFHSSTNSSPF